MEQSTSAETIAALMAAFRKGDKSAADKLVDIFHPQLRRLACAHMHRERQGHSWQPTLLVNELYLELIKIKALPASESDVTDEKSAFFGLAGHLMRRLLIHHSRGLRAKAINIELDNEVAIVAGTGSVAEVEQVLSRLDSIRPRLREIVELKIFEGMTLAEVAERLQCSPATVTREWHFTRHWLRKELSLYA